MVFCFSHCKAKEEQESIPLVSVPVCSLLMRVRMRCVDLCGLERNASS